MIGMPVSRTRARRCRCTASADSAARGTSCRSARPAGCCSSLRIGIARRRYSRAAPTARILPSVPSPRQPQMPVASVRAEQRTERAELEPPHVQLAGVLRRRHEAADVGAPVRNARQPGVDRDRHVRLQRFPRRVDVARPEKRAVALHAGEPLRCSANGRSLGRYSCGPSQYMRMRASRDGASSPSP